MSTCHFNNRKYVPLSILSVDKNGFHSQKALQGTYAYHLFLGDENKFNQLSFGLSMSVVQNQVDQTSFFNDPTVSQIVESNMYFNADLGMAYHYGGFSFYLTVKNMLLSAQGNLNQKFETLNLRNYIMGAGYFFGDKDKIQFEPSLMFQYKDRTGEKLIDLNLKGYKTLRNSQSQLWFGVSYRKGFEGSVFGDSNFMTSLLGLNYKRFMFGYMFTKQTGDIVFGDGNFHQLSFGMNILCRARRAAACPNINGGFL